MIRVVVYLVIVGLLAAGAAWLADRPGEVVITWQNRRIETSVMVLMIGAAAIAVLTTLVWSAVRAILRSPDILWLYLRTRRGVRGYLAVSQGLVAIGSGDARAAKKFADEASRIAPEEPLTLLLAAQASQLSGDREGAERIFQVMAGRDDTRLLGLHGLFIEAQRRDDLTAARLYAEAAAQSVASAGLGGACGVQRALRRRRFRRRAGTARPQLQERASRPRRLSPSARRAARRACVRMRGARSRRRSRAGA